MQKIINAHRKLFTALLIGALLTFAGCNKKESTVSVAPPSNEFLTTVELKLTNTANQLDTMTAIWRQLDPTGAALPDTSKAVLNLKANATYSAQVILLDETQSPAVVVSDEIHDRVNYHLFFFQPTPISASSLIISNTSTDIPASDGTVVSATGPYLNLVVSRTDLDNNTPPLQVGLTDNFVTGNASNGWLRVVLRHQPNVKNGTYDPGSTDLDVNYKISVN